MAIKLYDLAGAEDDRRFSPYCWRVKMALKHKGLDFETVAWRFTEKEALAPYKSATVPVLVDGTNSVYDSWAIALYLDEVYPSRPSLFSGNEARTLCDFFNQWTVKALHPVLMRVIIMDLFGTFQWARAVSPTRLLEPDDPLYAWRERLLKMYDGYAWKAKGYPVWV